jgi:dienelactone hydrolase
MIRKLLTLSLLLSACNCDAGQERSASEAAPTATQPATRAPEPPPAPVVVGDPSRPPETVRFPTDDGVTIVGTMHAAPKTGETAVVLVHQLSSNRAEWAPVIAELVKPPGVTVLAIDMRGHGESTEGRGRRALSWQDFDNDDWAKVVADVAGAVSFLETQGSLAPGRIVVVGSSIGGSAAILAAAANPRIAAVVAVSPGRAYKGIDALTPLADLANRPLLAIAAQDDAHSLETAQLMARIAGAGELEVYRGGAHGVAMLRDAPQMAARIAAFVRAGDRPAHVN